MKVVLAILLGCGLSALVFRPEHMTMEFAYVSALCVAVALIILAWKTDRIDPNGKQFMRCMVGQHRETVFASPGRKATLCEYCGQLLRVENGGK